METKSLKLLRKIIEYSFYLFIFLLPWQTKIILRPDVANFNEISLYVSHLLLLLILAVFFIYKLRRPATMEKISWLWLSLVGLETVILISFFGAPDQILAFYHYLLFLAGIGLFYILREGTVAFSYEEAIFLKAKIVGTFFLSIFLQAVLGIYQFLRQNTLVSKYLGLAQHYAAQPGSAVIEAVSGRWLRAYGGMDHPNIFGGVLAISLIIAAYILAKKRVLRSRSEVAESLGLFLFYFVGLFALFFTFSRAAWLAYGLGLFVLLLSLIIKKSDRWIIGRYLAILFFSAVAIFLVAYPYSDLIKARTTINTRLEQKSIDERQEEVKQATVILKDNWLLGVGIGNYVTALENRDNYSQSIWNYQPVHNIFLLLFAEGGIGALIFFCLFLVLLKKDRLAAYSGAIMIALIILMLFDHWLFSLPFGLLFSFLALGLI
jgi:O-antigen ligase